METNNSACHYQRNNSENRISKVVPQDVSVNHYNPADSFTNGSRSPHSKNKYHKSLEERSAAFGGQLLLDGEFDWSKAQGRENWT